MTEENAENMVLRTVYLPLELDRLLKNAALLGEQSKNDVIRDLIFAGIANFKDAKDPRFANLQEKSVGGKFATQIIRDHSGKPVGKVRKVVLGRTG